MLEEQPFAGTVSQRPSITSPDYFTDSYYEIRPLEARDARFRSVELGTAVQMSDLQASNFEV